MAQRKKTIKNGGFDPNRCRYDIKKLQANERVMDYLRRVSHYETTSNIQAHIFALTGWNVNRSTVVKLQGGSIKAHTNRPNKNVVARRVLWDRIIALSRQGMLKRQIVETLGITIHCINKMERIHRVKIKE